MSIQDFNNDSIVIIHGGNTNKYEVSFQGRKVIGPVDIEVAEDDVLICISTQERFIVTSVERYSSTRRMGRNMDHCTLKVIPEKQALKQQDASARTQITQHIGTAHTVAGRDIHGGVNTTITHIIDALATAVSEADNIPEAEKPSLLEKIKELATNPFILGIGPPLILEALRTKLGLAQK